MVKPKSAVRTDRMGHCAKRETGMRAFPALAGAFILAAFLAACAKTPAPVADNTPPFYRNLESSAARLDVQDAAQVISAYRASKGLGPVVLDPVLLAIAQDHATAQARADKVGHSIGGTFSSRIRAVENQRGVSVENVSAGYRSFAEAFSGWRESPRHNDNLLRKEVTRLGIATAINPESKFKVFWTLVMTSDPLGNQSR